MDSNLFKCQILCQIFPKVDDVYWGVAFTPTETLVCYAKDLQELKESLAISVEEVCRYIDGKITEEQFEKDLQEREMIMRKLMAKHGIPLENDLYKSLTEYFPYIQEGYRPFEHFLSEFKNQPKKDIRSIGDILHQRNG